MNIPNNVRWFCEKTQTPLPINEDELRDILERMASVGF